MRICKSDSLSAIVRVIRLAEQDLLSVAVLGAFAFEAPETLLGEEEVWRAAKDAAPQGALLDEGLPKPHGEFLLAGCCFAPHGRALPELDVRVSVGKCMKRLAVFGDRCEDGAPAPFTSMRLDWSRAYGGPEHPDNPCGTPSPNIETPQQVLAASGSGKASEPAGFGPLRPDWGPRLRLAGSYDQAWLRAQWPWFPKDMSPEFFNMAPRDQWLEEYFRGDEPIRLRNLHPTREELALTLRLPRLRAVLVEPSSPGKAHYRALEPHAETLWLFPNQERGVAIWRIVAPVVADKKASNVEGLSIFDEPRDAEPCDSRRYYERYREFFEDETPELAAPSKPEATPPPQPQAPPATPTPDPAFAALCAVALAHSQEADAALDTLLLSCGAALPTTDSVLTPAKGIEPDPNFEETLERLKDADEHLERMLGELNAGVTLDAPTAAAAPDPAQLATILRQAGGLPPELEAYLTQISADNAVWDRNVAAFKASFPPDKGPKTSAEPEALTAPRRLERAEIERRLAAGESLAGLDLRGLDLRGLDLTGADLSNALLLDADLRGVTAAGACFENALLTGALAEEAIFRGARMQNAVLERVALTRADLSQADLSGARLTEARLSNVNATGAILRGADLTGVQAVGADFRDADLCEAVLVKADLRSASFERANLETASFEGADAANARFAQAQAEDASFVEARLDNADFSQSILKRADFSLARLDAAIFRKAQAVDAAFYGAVGEGVCFAGARLCCARADETTTLSAADFRDCDLSEANFSGADLRKAVLQRATLHMANFTGTRLNEADLRLAVARHAKFVEADLHCARLAGIDLFQGNLSGAQLHAADFTSSNLFEVEFLDARVSPSTCFTGANLARTKLAMTNDEPQR